jgi:capsid portal protein
MDVISLMDTTNQIQLMLPKSSTITTTLNDEYLSIKSTNEQINELSQPLMIDFNDPSTINFLLSALASGASSDSNAIINHLF